VNQPKRIAIRVSVTVALTLALLQLGRRYAPDYSGLAGKDLTPRKSVEEMEPNQGNQGGGS
jgi:hypothetical protein